MDLFENAFEHSIRSDAPLADRMRPRTLEEFVGQEHLLAPGRLLRRAIQADQLSSVIFYGPPGTGKTLLARAMACNVEAKFLKVVASSVVDKYIGESARVIREMFGVLKRELE